MARLCQSRAAHGFSIGLIMALTAGIRDVADRGDSFLSILTLIALTQSGGWGIRPRAGDFNFMAHMACQIDAALRQQRVGALGSGHSARSLAGSGLSHLHIG